MIRPALLVALALLAAACGDKEPAVVNDTSGDAILAQENVVGGDVTAIDAATADDARMAADVAPPSDDDLGNDSNATDAGNEP